jgi:hypothetical protein
MDFDLATTAAAFVALIAVGIGGLVAMDAMAIDTIMMMVAPSMVAFGLICLGLGMKFGEHRSRTA